MSDPINTPVPIEDVTPPPKKPLSGYTEVEWLILAAALRDANEVYFLPAVDGMKDMTVRSLKNVEQIVEQRIRDEEEGHLARLGALRSLLSAINTARL